MAPRRGHRDSQQHDRFAVVHRWRGDDVRPHAPRGESDELRSADGGKIVAGYVGQTAIQVRKAFDEADGGVLFIDEAYALARGGEGDFGKEASWAGAGILPPAPPVGRARTPHDLLAAHSARLYPQMAEELRAAYAPWCAIDVLDQEDGWILMGGQRSV